MYNVNMNSLTKKKIDYRSVEFKWGYPSFIKQNTKFLIG